MIKTILKSVREYKKKTIFTMLLSTIEVFFEILIPLTMSNLIDYGISNGDMNQVLKFGLFLFLEAALQMMIGMVSAHLAANTAAGFAANLREDMYRNVQTFSFASIDKFSTASIVTRLTTDITNIQQSYQMSMRMAIRSPMMLIFSVIFAFRIDKEISLIFLLIIPLLAGALILVATKAHKYFKQVFQTYDKLNNVAQENIRGIRVVKSFNQEEYEINKFEKISKKIYDLFIKAESIVAFNNPSMQLCVYSSMILICFFGAKAVVASGNNPTIGLTTGNLMALIQYDMQILMSLMMLSMVFVMLIISLSNMERVAEILNEKTDITSKENALTTVVNGDVVFENVGFVYASKADKKVLNQINLHFESGQTIGIIGDTGSSKTSLVQLIPRLYDVSEGRVLVGGVDVRDYNLQVLRDAVSMVLQKNELFSGTIKENLRWGNPEATDEQMKEACQLSCADEFIQQMPKQYDTYIEQGGTNVSGGQKQRLCIARALLKKPKILILDDSTSAVDTKTDAMIQQAFQNYIPSTTKIIIAQRISSVIHADQIVVMHDGKVLACGTHQQLLENCEVYQEIYDSQNKKGGQDDGKENDTTEKNN